MKSALFAASTAILLCAAPVAYAQNAGPTYSNTIHQSASDRDSRGYPKYYQSERRTWRHPRLGYMERSPRMGRSYNRSTTTGAGSGPTYDNSIHQSAGDRDSRGNPKYNQER